ncbi:MAG: hypothetical protein R2856_27415 [Caldilineaceae bacterium]
MIHESVYEIQQNLKGIGIDNGKVEVLDDAKVRGQLIDTLRATSSLARNRCAPSAAG